MRLVREVEFNSASHRVNAEYLMNVLKKFLMSEVPSERSKLASVLCSILHVRPEESKVIEMKWAVKRPTGIAGWFLSKGDRPSNATALQEGTGDDFEAEVHESDET